MKGVALRRCAVNNKNLSVPVFSSAGFVLTERSFAVINSNLLFLSLDFGLPLAR